MSKWILYEDSLLQAILSEHPVAKGHIEIKPKKTVKNMSDLSDEEIEHLFFTASYSATALFELLGAHGTNIILNESDDELCVHVIVRFQDDGLDFLWKPNPASPDELKDTAKSIRDAVDYEIWAKEHPDEIKSTEKQQPETIISSSQEGEDNSKKNYMLSSLRRIP